MKDQAISQDSPLPIPAQLREILVREIREKKFLGGKRFPSERELAERFEVSRASVRETISELIASGILFRTVGRGTFVADEPVRTSGHQVAFLINEDIFSFAETGYGRILRGVEDACRRRRRRPHIQVHRDRCRSALQQGIVQSRWHRHRRRSSSTTPGTSARSANPGSAGRSFRFHTKFDDIETVNIDYAGGTKRAMDRLFELGHRKIGFIGFPGSDKYESYWQSSAVLGLQYDRAVS